MYMFILHVDVLLHVWFIGYNYWLHFILHVHVHVYLVTHLIWLHVHVVHNI